MLGTMELLKRGRWGEGRGLSPGVLQPGGSCPAELAAELGWDGPVSQGCPEHERGWFENGH